MEVLVLDGKSYVKASKAARDLGYATDYVGQLCRSGKVDAHLIGRTWYVNPDQLGSHRFEKKRMSRIKAREQAKKSIEAHRLKVAETQKNYRNIDIRYESDPEELIPEVRKLEVDSSATRIRIKESDTYDSKTVIENKGEKVRMSGDLKVVDVTDAPIETDIVTLTPGRIRSGTITVMPQHTAETAPEELSDAGEEVSPEPLSFEEKIQALTDEADTHQESPSDPAFEVLSEESAGSKAPYVVAILLTLLLVVMTLPILREQTYSSVSKEIVISYSFSFEKILSEIRSKI